MRITILVCVALQLVLSPRLLAQSSGGEFEITKHSIDSGGGRSTGGNFVLDGTLGQPDASLSTASGGEFQLTGGFWANGVIVPAGELLFSDSFEEAAGL